MIRDNKNKNILAGKYCHIALSVPIRKSDLKPKFRAESKDLHLNHIDYWVSIETFHSRILKNLSRKNMQKWLSETLKIF